MNVDDSVSERIDECRGEDLHITCQYNKVYIVFLKKLYYALFLFFLLAVDYRHVVKQNIEFFCNIAQGVMIAYYHGYIANEIILFIA